LIEFALEIEAANLWTKLALENVFEMMPAVVG
jgi:hypothetical protein